MAYIKLPDSMNVNDIVLQTIRLNGIIVPVTDTKYGYVKNPISDYDGDGKLEFMVKFSKESLLGILTEGQNTISFSGETGSYQFTWTGIIEAKSSGK